MRLYEGEERQARNSRVSDTAQQDVMTVAASRLAQGQAVIALCQPRPGTRGRGFFLFSAARASAEVVNQAITWGRGLTCFSVTAERAMQLGLVLAAEVREGRPGPLFLRSVEAAECDDTGISAADRAMTLRAAGAADAGVGSLKSPGHVMPALAGFRNGDACSPADLALTLLRALTGEEVAAWSDILDDDGELGDADYCRALASELGLPCVTHELAATPAA